MRIFMLLLALATLFSCAEDLESSDVAAIDPEFFNLKEFVAEQKEKMAGKSINKTVIVNGIEETKTLKEVDWELELAPFAQSNIDKAALWDGYKWDSTSCRGLLKFVYLSIDSSNFTKTLEVTFEDKVKPLDSVYAIIINNGLNSYLAKNTQRLVWWQDGYEIQSTQEAMLSEERVLRIKSEWGTKVVGPCVESSFFEPTSNYWEE